MMLEEGGGAGPPAGLRFTEPLLPCSDCFHLPVLPAGLPWLRGALLSDHAGLHPEAAESCIIAASGLHAQKPQCPVSAAPAASPAAAATATAVHA